MKYEEIKVGVSYEYRLSVEKVISKNDEYKAVMTVDESGAFNGWSVEEIVSFQPIKKELPENGLLVHKNGSLAFRTGERTGYGFGNMGGFCSNDGRTFKSHSELWKPATPEDEAKFIKLLKAEAEKRGLGVDAKIKRHAGVWRTAFNTNTYTPKFSLDFAVNKHGRIFKNGIWAEPLTMLDEVTEVIKKHLPNIVVEMTDGVVTLKQL